MGLSSTDWPIRMINVSVKSRKGHFLKGNVCLCGLAVFNGCETVLVTAESSGVGISSNRAFIGYVYVIVSYFRVVGKCGVIIVS